MGTHFSVGGRFGQLTVVELITGNRCVCKCDCGEVRSYFRGNLTRKSKGTKSCGASRCRPTRSNLKDLTGMRVGRLSIIGYAGSKRWNCKCDCGAATVVLTGNLRAGINFNKDMSCGCSHGYKNPALRNRRLVSNDKAALQYLWRHQQRQVKKVDEGKTSWGITEEVFERLIFSPCHYCGAVGSNRVTHTYRKVGNKGELRYNGLDRVDPVQGYTPSNVVSCCWQCNKTKGKLPYQEFVLYISRVARHLGIN